jgi:hypothetical protein
MGLISSKSAAEKGDRWLRAALNLEELDLGDGTFSCGKGLISIQSSITDCIPGTGYWSPSVSVPIREAGWLSPPASGASSDLSSAV